MIDLKFLRENPDLVKENIKKVLDQTFKVLKVFQFIQQDKFLIEGIRITIGKRFLGKKKISFQEI